MHRESLNLTFSESLRRAQVRTRLDALAEHTGLNSTQIAGRALTLGLALIETDLRRLFPGQALEGNATPFTPGSSPAPIDAAPQHAASSLTAASSVEQSRTATESDALPCAATASIDTKRSAITSPPTSESEEASDTPPRFVSTSDATRALGYREETAFRQHCRRHPELRKLSHKQGRALLWNLAKLRSEYTRQAWQPR